MPAGFRRYPNEEHCLNLVARTIEYFGKLDILVNNAAFQMEHDDIASLPTEEFERTFKTNVFATFWLSKAALRHMQPGSVILNTSSIQAYDPSPGLLAYSPSKAAIINFTKGLAKEAIKKGVRVNAVAPGPVWTPLIPSTLSEEHIQRFGDNTLLERPAQPAEMAPSMHFLLRMTPDILQAKYTRRRAGAARFNSRSTPLSRNTAYTFWL